MGAKQYLFLGLYYKELPHFSYTYEITRIPRQLLRCTPVVHTWDLIKLGRKPKRGENILFHIVLFLDHLMEVSVFIIFLLLRQL